MRKERKAAFRQQIEFLTPEKAPAEGYGIAWWAVLYTLLSVGAELTLDSVWTDKMAYWPPVLAMTVLLLGCGYVQRFRPARYHWLLRLLPWLVLGLSFLAGSPFTGGADWLNSFLRQWNANHDTLYRELGVTASRWDQTAFLLLALVLLSKLTLFLLKKRRLWLACSYVALFTAMGFLTRTGRLAWFPLLLAGLLGYFLSGPAVQIGGRGAFLWGLAAAVLALGLLLPVGEMEEVAQLRSSTDRQIHELRYGKEKLPLGNLYDAGKLAGGEQTELEIRSEQSKDLYLRAYIGGTYHAGQWEPLPEAAYGGENTGMFTWLKNQSFQPQTQLSRYFALGTGTTQENLVQVRVEDACREWFYAPSSLEVLRTSQVSADKDREPTARGLFGKRSYEYKELSGSRPGELTVPEGWVTNPRNEEQEQYLQAEAVYRDFVYENYTTVDSRLAGLIDAVFHKEEPDNDSTFSILTYVREVLRTRCRFDRGGADLSEGEDPIVYFLTYSHRGNSALFASAAVEALRSYGIPVRYAEGYRCTQSRLAESGGDWTALTGRDRHAWVEIYFDGMGWIAVDVTPGYYYDLVSLQRLVSLPDDVTKTSDLTKNDTLADEDSGNDGPGQPQQTEDVTVRFSVEKLLPYLAIPVLLAVLALLLAELLRGVLLLVLRRRFHKAEPLDRAKRSERLLFALLSAKGIPGGLGWNTEQLDAQITEAFPRVTAGEYTRVCGLLEKAVYGDIPPEIYEERTILTMLRKLVGMPAGSGLRTRLRGRYGWLSGALR